MIERIEVAAVESERVLRARRPRMDDLSIRVRRRLVYTHVLVVVFEPVGISVVDGEAERFLDSAVRDFITDEVEQVRRGPVRIDVLRGGGGGRGALLG